MVLTKRKRALKTAGAALSVLLVGGAAQAGTLDDIGRSISSLWQQKARKHEAAQQARSRARAQTRQVQFLHQRLERTQQLLQAANTRYANTFAQMRRTEAQLVATRHRVQLVTVRYDAHKKQFGRRLAAMQRHGQTNYLQVALGSHSFSDLTRRTAFFQALTQRDAQLQADIKADRAELLGAQNTLMAQWKERNALQIAANRERTRIAQGTQEQKQMWRQLNSSRLALLNYAQAQAQSSREITGMISSLEARKAQIIADYEAQAGRERAAARQAALEQAQTLRAQQRFRPRVRYNRDNGARRDSEAPRTAQERRARRYAGQSAPNANRLAPRLAPRVDVGPRFAPRVELAPMPLGQLQGWTLPARGPLSSRFGMRFHPILHRERMHTGDDIAAAYGSPIRAAKSGRVLWAGWKTAYGNTVIVDIGNGMTTLYGHASKLGVRAGQPIAAGEYIGNVGSTGFSTGPHLHFEVRKNGRPIDPTRYLHAR